MNKARRAHHDQQCFPRVTCHRDKSTACQKLHAPEQPWSPGLPLSRTAAWLSGLGRSLGFSSCAPRAPADACAEELWHARGHSYILSYCPGLSLAPCVGLGFLVRLRFASRSHAVWRVRAIAPSFIFGWRAFSSVSLWTYIYIFTERDGRKGPPAENKARCDRTNTPHSKATQRKAKPNQKSQTHTRGARQA
jgi:hypothetical protein